MDYDKTIALNPEYPDAHGNAAWLLATSSKEEHRNPKKALEYALVEAQRTKMEAANTLDTLAAAYAANDSFPEAITHQQKAIDKAASPSDKVEFQERLQLYLKNQRYVEASK